MKNKKSIRDSAYEWAWIELNLSVKTPEEHCLNRLDTFPGRISIFHRGDDEPTITRIYSEDADEVHFALVANYDSLISKYPHLIEECEENAIEDYFEMLYYASRFFHRHIRNLDELFEAKKEQHHMKTNGLTV